jgi:hypothetical protein
MNDQTQISPRSRDQRTSRAAPITPWRRRHREKMRLRAKRLQWPFKLAEREANKLRMRVVRARRKGAGDQIAARQPATHQLPQ